MNGHQFGLTSTRISPRRATLATDVSIPEGVEGSAVKTANGGRCAAAAGSSRSLGRGVVKGTDGFPACFGTLEEDGLTIMSGGHECVFGGPGEGDVGKSGDFDSDYGGGGGINDRDGGVVTYRMY